MRLTGVVTKVESARGYTDGVSRVYVHVNEADGMYAEFRVPNVDGMKLDDQVEIELNLRAKVEVLNGK